jgi:hypothetical protein
MVSPPAITTTRTMPDMATPSERQSFQSLAAGWSARAFVCLLGIGAVAWAGFVLPSLWWQIPLNSIAAEYVQGHNLPLQSLSEEARRIKTLEQASPCNPTALHDRVILRLSILEEAVTQHVEPLVGSARTPLYEAIRDSLACAPADPVVWLTLFWLSVRGHDVQPRNIGYLRLSYAFGPNEGWISLWRNRLAMTLFERLPADVADHALDEFVKLVGTGRLYSETVAIFASVSPVIQSRIVRQLKNSSAVSREVLASLLYDRGIEIKIPNTTNPTLEPWDRKGLDIKLPDVELLSPRPY